MESPPQYRNNCALRYLLSVLALIVIKITQSNAASFAFTQRRFLSSDKFLLKF